MTYCNIQGRSEPLFEIREIMLKNGKRFTRCFANSYATPLPGYLAIREYVDSQATTYINTTDIAFIVISDENADKLNCNLISPIEYKERGF